jgi:hypothetical protein
MTAKRIASFIEGLIVFVIFVALIMAPPVLGYAIGEALRCGS